ncbi:MAG: cation diffusion facilitator family transporter [Pseudomonadota bacterium]
MPHDATHDTLPGALRASDASRITKAVARLSVATASVLIALKLWAWLASDSVAMLSSLADSGLDGFASLFTLIAVSYAAAPPDAEHRYGHGKAEGFAAMVQAALVGVSAIFVAIEAISRFRAPQPIAESTLALAVMVVSIALTLGLIWAQSRAISKTGSVATKGDRAHYAADLAANGAVIVGISLAAFTGLGWADPLVGLLVAVWLAWSAVEVAQGGWDQLLDREVSDEARQRIAELALSSGVLLDVHQLRTRTSGPYIHIQFHAEMPPHLSLVEAHAAMVAAEKAILSEFPAADVLIHPDPRGHAEPHGSDVFAETAE